MKFLIGLAATAMSALLLTPTLSPGEVGTEAHSSMVAENALDARGLRA